MAEPHDSDALRGFGTDDWDAVDEASWESFPASDPPATRRLVHHSRFSTVIIDCQTTDARSAATFWSQAFGRQLVDDGNPSYVSLRMHDGEVLCQIQAVSHTSRVHLDIETDNVDAEVARLAALGAREVERHPTWVVMEAPTGQRFCVGRPKSADFPTNANRWE